MDGVNIIPALAYQEECEHVELLVAKLQHPDNARRRKGAEAMAMYIGDQRCLPAEPFDIHPAQVLVDFIEAPSSDSTLQISCVKALAQMVQYASPFASKCLANLLNPEEEREQELKWEAARALGFLGPSAAEGAAEAMGICAEVDEDAMVRMQCCRSAEKMGAAAAKYISGSLAKALWDTDADVQTSAVRALVVMGPGAADAAADALVKTIQEGRYEMRRLAADALMNMGEAAAPYAAKPIAQILRPDGAPWSHGHEPPGSDSMLRRMAAETLSAFGQAAVEEHEIKLARALNDMDPMVRRAAKETLQLAGCRLAMKGSIALFKDAYGRTIVLDGEPEPVPPEEEIKLRKKLKLHNCTGLSDWLREMGVETFAQMAELYEDELVEKGLTPEEAATLIAEAKREDAQVILEDVLRENNAHDLLRWLQRDYQVLTVADLANFSEEELIEEGLLTPETARALLDTARDRVQEIAAAAAEAERERNAGAIMDDDDFELLNAHAESGVCWCGLSHKEMRESKAAVEAEQRQREEEAAEKQRELDEIEGQVKKIRVNQRAAKAQAKRQSRKDELVAIEAKHKALQEAIRLKQEAEKQRKHEKAEEARRKGLRPPAWSGGAQIFEAKEWADVPLLERLVAGGPPADKPDDKDIKPASDEPPKRGAGRKTTQKVVRSPTKPIPTVTDETS